MLKKFDVNSFLIGFVTVLMTIIGFLTREAFLEIKQDLKTVQTQVVTLQSNVSAIQAVMAEKK